MDWQILIKSMSGLRGKEMTTEVSRKNIANKSSLKLYSDSNNASIVTLIFAMPYCNFSMLSGRVGKRLTGISREKR